MRWLVGRYPRVAAGQGLGTRKTEAGLEIRTFTRPPPPAPRTPGRGEKLEVNSVTHAQWFNRLHLHNATSLRPLGQQDSESLQLGESIHMSAKWCTPAPLAQRPLGLAPFWMSLCTLPLAVHLFPYNKLVSVSELISKSFVSCSSRLLNLKKKLWELWLIAGQSGVCEARSSWH